jgi:hypothetical protein
VATVTCGLTVPKAALKALTELTGGPRFDVALRIALRDAVDHRPKRIDEGIGNYERKAGMSFDGLQTRGQAEETPNQFSFEVESDFLEWG